MAAAPEARALLADWVDAFEKGNTPRMVALLTADKTGYNQEEKKTYHVQETPRSGRGKSERASGKERADAQ
jgi:hypothetical protein